MSKEYYTLHGVVNEPALAFLQKVGFKRLTVPEESKKLSVQKGDLVKAYIDVDNRIDAPPLPVGLRYFDMIGGTKNIRMFIAPETMLRGEFMKQNEHLMDESLKPIFINDDIVVRQDI